MRRRPWHAPNSPSPSTRQRAEGAPKAGDPRPIKVALALLDAARPVDTGDGLVGGSGTAHPAVVGGDRVVGPFNRLPASTGVLPRRV